MKEQIEKALTRALALQREHDPRSRTIGRGITRCQPGAATHAVIINDTSLEIYYTMACAELGYDDPEVVNYYKRRGKQ